MNQLQEQRKRIFALLESHLTSESITSLDYQIDDFLRKQLNLPNRPDGDSPYIGWLVGKKEPTEGKMKTSFEGIALIKSHEGIRTRAYVCPGGVLTIGYGHTRTVYPNQLISQEKAEQLLKEDLAKFENAVNQYVKVPLNQNQFDALVSFTFNVGISAFRNSTLLRLLNNQNYYKAACQFSRWVNAGTTKLPGLVRRRKDEKSLFLKK